MRRLIKKLRSMRKVFFNEIQKTKQKHDKHPFHALTQAFTIYIKI